MSTEIEITSVLPDLSVSRNRLHFVAGGTGYTLGQTIYSSSILYTGAAEASIVPCISAHST